jgi:hypothetical protein
MEMNRLPILHPLFFVPYSVFDLPSQGVAFLDLAALKGRLRETAKTWLDTPQRNSDNRSRND